MSKSESLILEVAHETVKGLYVAGLMEQVVLREFDGLCLPPVESLPSNEIR